MSSHMSNPSSRVELVEDVKRIILGYLSLYTDLQALCLTSKSWNCIATEYLYRKVVLEVRAQDGQLALFRQCVDSGARKHLVHTRSLSLLNLLPWEFGTVSSADRPMDEATRNALMSGILQDIPSNKLREFRYVAWNYDGMYPSLVSLLKEHQQSIDSLHVLRGDSRKLISPKTRRVTVAFRGQNDQTHKFVQFALALPTLDSLSILFLEGWTLKVHRYWGDGHNISAFRDQKIVARTLMLDGCMPDTFDSALPYVFDLSRVTKLALSGCKLDLLQHLSSSCELRNLTDFGIRTPEHFDETAGENARALFLKNQSLQHLRLHINGLHSVSLDPQDTPDATPYLWPLHPRLKTLSLLDLYREGDNEHFPFIVEPELQQICSHFSALEQLGLCFYDFDIPRSEAEKRFSYVIKILEPIERLKNLKILHLYQDRVRTVRPPTPQVHICEIHQEFATRFFQWAHHRCPLLEVLIWGTYEENFHQEAWQVTEDAKQGRDTSECGVDRAPQQCFVKKLVELEDGTSQIAGASRVTRSRIRDDFPELQILSYETGRHIETRLADEAVR
ncbi:hypothetical protein AA0119_g5965 [Alternaria tenuissima]|uniref:F-box domain-containing protein n=2 Tax=Alternaria alternata complex TaxID=187734 RepID=A0A4V1WQP1_ALTAL|nr:hypothetical protein AA0115_g11618 [Alternaria tenuissima]RYN71107.1 hypothetical protein AA0117_g9855 [Alternaria alternata]RYO00524.1 hypothetical protein AA0119_g5965 [Alternaria tenuissima]RYO14325.1 hypothetical protein AA0121_g7690 [Alternaria tenuissima]